MNKEKDWLKKQIELASKEIDEWPQWMKDGIREEIPQEQVKNCSTSNVVLSLPDDEAIEQWWAEGKESDKFWQDAPYRTNGDVVEEIKTALKYFITVWQ